jgi:hypothetical protein
MPENTKPLKPKSKSKPEPEPKFKPNPKPPASPSTSKASSYLQSLQDSEKCNHGPACFGGDTSGMRYCREFLMEFMEVCPEREISKERFETFFGITEEEKVEMEREKSAEKVIINFFSRLG